MCPFVNVQSLRPVSHCVLAVVVDESAYLGRLPLDIDTYLKKEKKCNFTEYEWNQSSLRSFNLSALNLGLQLGKLNFQF